MKLLRKWLFPALTCLIVIGAAVLPPRLSQARDAREFGQVHAEALEAEELPVYEPPSLLDRLKLFVRWSSGVETIPSFQSREEQYVEKAKQVTWEALEQLVDGGLIPDYLAEGLELTSWSYVLLWDTESSIADQAPTIIWRVSADFGDKAWMATLWMDVDAESGLPLTLDVYDSDINQWLPYEADAFQQWTDQYLALLGLDVELVDVTGPKENGGLALDYDIRDTNFGYWARYAGMMFATSPTIILNGGDSSSASGYDD